MSLAASLNDAGFELAMVRAVCGPAEEDIALLRVVEHLDDFGLLALESLWAVYRVRKLENFLLGMYIASEIRRAFLTARDMPRALPGPYSGT